MSENNAFNLDAYSREEVVTHYEAAEGLMPPERYLFAKYALPGLAILDIGVGGGRTTPHLAAQASRYLGVDYSQAMVDACRRRFPDQKFAVADATAMRDIADSSFDLTIFSFNGIDYITDDDARVSALMEMSRVTRSNGVMIISSHNAKMLLHYPQLQNADFMHKIWRIARSLAHSVPIAKRHIMTGAYSKGAGYVHDAVHGGLKTHLSSRESIKSDCEKADLDIIEVVGANHPKRIPEFMNSWNHFVLQRRK